MKLRDNDCNNCPFMNQIDKLKKALNTANEENENFFNKIIFCQDHKFDIEASVLKKVYDAKRDLLRTIKLTVLDELL